MTDAYVTFSDETQSGRGALALRNSGQATIAARTTGEDFDWIERFRRDYLPGCKEVKAGVALPVMAVTPIAREFVLRRVSDYTIVIIDLGTYTKELLRLIVDHFGIPCDSDEDPLRVIRSPAFHREVAERVLIALQLEQLQLTAIPRIERLLREVAFEALPAAALPSGLFDRNALLEMRPAEFRELVARFSVAFADALDPQVHAATLVKALSDIRYLSDDRLAYLRLETAIAPDRVYDQGNAPVFELIRSAHGIIVAHLEAARHLHLHQTMKPGTLRQDDSVTVRGLQAADLAAGIATEEFEKHSGDTRGRASAVKQVFRRVFLNDEWL